MSEARWEIVGGPEPYTRSGSRDETAWLWSIARSRAERRSVVFAITGSAVVNVAGGEADVPLELADAYRTKGRSVIAPLCGKTRPPRTIVMDSTGKVTSEDWSAPGRITRGRRPNP
jgi:hypothetical protein